MAACKQDLSEVFTNVVSDIGWIEELNEKQKSAISLLLEGKDVLVLLPTGFGKSVIFQLFPKIFSEVRSDRDINPIVIVVSPLQALVASQILEAEKLGISATRLFDEDDEAITSGKFSLVYGSPENWLGDRGKAILSSDRFKRNVVAVAADEVHKVKWGEQRRNKSPFRKLFGQLGNIRSFLQQGVPVVALTASADIDTERKIAAAVNLSKEFHVVSAPIDRPNVRLSVMKIQRDELSCLDWIINMVKEEREKTPKVIIFCRTINLLTTVYSYLKMQLRERAFIGSGKLSDDLLIGMYHSNTLDKHKKRVAESLGAEDGLCRVVVATTALSMGVNFKDIRYVVNYGLPVNLEDFVQQTGRAGRDMCKAHGIIYYHGSHITHCDSEVKDFVRNDTCLRELLFSPFNREGENSTQDLSQPKHDCCINCSKSCLCELNGCSKHFNYESKPVLVEPFFQRSVSDEEKSVLISCLKEFQSKLRKESYRLFGQDVTSGFTDSLINDIVHRAEYIFEVDYLTQHLPIFSTEQALQILHIFNEVFDDIDHLDEIKASVDCFIQTDPLGIHSEHHFESDTSSGSEYVTDDEIVAI